MILSSKLFTPAKFYLLSQILLGMLIDTKDDGYTQNYGYAMVCMACVTTVFSTIVFAKTNLSFNLK